MRKDFKIGVFVGTGLAICICIAMSMFPSGSVQSRLKDNRERTTTESFIIIDDAAPADDTEQASTRITKTDSPPKQRIHTVIFGETLSSIAMDYYGTNDYSRIDTANVIEDPARLKVGTKLIIPE